VQQIVNNKFWLLLQLNNDNILVILMTDISNEF